MSGQSRLVTTTFTNVDISAGANAVYTYTCPVGESHALFFRVFCTTVAGSGDYVFWLTLQEGGAGNTATILPKTTGTAGAADTTIAALTTTVMVDAGDVVKVYIDGLGGDGAVSGTIKVYELVSNLTSILGTTLTETVTGYLAAGFKKLLNVATPLFTLASINQTGDAYDELIDLEATLITLPDLFTVNTGQTGAGAVAGSVVHEIGHAVLAIGTVFPAGAVNYTYTLTDSVTGLPIQGADVWFSTDAPGINIIWKGVTDVFGVARDVLGNLPALDAGVYRVWSQRAGYAASAFPDTETVP